MKETQKTVSPGELFFKRALRIVCLIVFLGVFSRAQGEEGRRPNVLFLAVDDLRPQLGCYGHSEILSPNIDALASQGVLFEQSFCQAAHCCPSRASLMTGLRPDHAGVVTGGDPYFRDTVPDVVTLPQYFAANGYRTVKTGKLFHNNQDPQSWQTILNEWRQPDVALYNDPVSKDKFKNALKTIEKMTSEGKLLEPWERVRMMLSTSSESVDVPDSAYPDGAITDLALQALREMKDSGEPTFLGVGWYKPHLPFNCPSKYWDLYDPEKIHLAENPQPPKNVPSQAVHEWEELRAYADIPRTGPLSDEQALRLIHGYYACVSFADAQVGRILRELDELGLADNTIVILWGDHGWHLGDHGMWCKQSNFETATHAPLIVRSPGIEGGKRVKALTEFIDIYPTVCELAGLPVPETLDGQSLKPLLENPKYKPWKQAALSQFPRGKFVGRSTRNDRYRFTVWENSKTGDVDAMELYDHKTDPQENVNIAGNPENKKLVQKLMTQYRTLWDRKAEK